MRGAWLFTLCLLGASAARAGEWRYEDPEEDGRSSARLRYTLRADLWISEYDRPARACTFGGTDVAVPEPGFAGPRNPGEVFCNAANSDELGIGSGIMAEFRVLGPVYLLAGLDLVYSTPDSGLIKNQLIVSLPLGVMVTPYAWTFRPILRAQLAPVIYVTDDSRDYSIGGDAGFALRATDWGDLSLTVGYHQGETISSWQIQFGLHPIP